jgi:HEAT repeat protein
MDESRLYRTLGVRFDASPEEIKCAYRKLVKQFHPDLSGNTASSEQFKRVVKAYKTLSVRVPDRTCIDFPVREVRKTGSPAGAGTRPRPRPASKEIDIEALGNMTLNARAPEMRAFAARQLGNSGKRISYQFLRKALFDTSRIVVRSAVDAVGTLRVRQCAGELSLVFNKADPEIRLAVLNAVGKIGYGESFSTIINLAMQDRDRVIRNKAIELFAAGKGA